MKTPPFILVNCLETSGGVVTRGSGRSVAFPVAKTKEGKYLFCTCSHAITDHLDKGGSLHFCYDDGSDVPLGERVLNNVVPPELNFDLSFFEADIDRKIGIARFSGRSVVPGLELSHVRNVCYREDFPDQKSVFTTQTVEARTGKFMLDGGSFHKVDADLKRLLGTMPKSPHKGVAMRSWPGVSGSPLWDKTGGVLGMVAGGTEELTKENPRFNLIYLPAKQIQSCMKKFLSKKIV